MDTNPIILGVGGIVIAVLTYFATNWWNNERHQDAMQNAEKLHKEALRKAERQYDEENSEQRIRKVVENYLRFREKRENGGLGGMQKAGVGNLANDAEIRKAAEMIMNTGRKDPLQIKTSKLHDVDLKYFFQQVSESGLNFSNENPVLLIEKIKGQKIGAQDEN